MSKSQGFSVHVRENGLFAASVTPTGKTGWRLEALVRGTTATGLDRKLVKAMNRSGRGVAWLLPDDDAATSFVSVPRLKGKALERALQGGVARDEGGRPQDWVVSPMPLPKEKGFGGDDNVEYFLLYADKEKVDAQLEAARACQVRAGSMLPGHLALESFYRRYGPEREDHESWSLVFVGQNQRFVSISTRDSQLLVRPLPQDLSEGSNPEEYLDRLATEVDRSAFFARQTQQSPDIQRVIVCGDAGIAPGLVEKLNADSSIGALHWPIEDLIGWGQHDWTPDDLILVAGAVLSQETLELNLITGGTGLKLSPAMKRRGLVAVSTLAVVLGPVLLAGGIYTARIQDEYLETAQGRIADARDKAEQAELVYDAQRVLMARENTIRQFTGKKPDLEAVLLKLADLTPPQVMYREMKVKEITTGNFVLKLSGESLADTGGEAQTAFMNLLTALQNCDFLVLRGEPVVMQIADQEERDDQGKMTIFSLDLHVVVDGETVEEQS